MLYSTSLKTCLSFPDKERFSSKECSQRPDPLGDMAVHLSFTQPG
jgi:hypothetical protein